MTGDQGPDTGQAAGEPQKVPAWQRQTPGEPRWHASVVVLAAIALQLALPARLGLRPKLLLPCLEAVLVVALLAADPGRIERQRRGLRTGSLALVGLVTLANAVSAGLLVTELLRAGSRTGSAGSLLASGATVYATNIIAFGLWYWEIDLGGPARRALEPRLTPDLLFPQMTKPGDIDYSDWEPMLFDYLYVSYTNATAFSPTDTLPMSRWTKAMMGVQSTVALVTLALVIARSVNILR